MALLSLYHQFETNLMSNRKVIELLLQLKSAKAHGKNYIKVKPHLVRHLLRNRIFPSRDFDDAVSCFVSSTLLIVFTCRGFQKLAHTGGGGGFPLDSASLYPN